MKCSLWRQQSPHLFVVRREIHACPLSKNMGPINCTTDIRWKFQKWCNLTATAVMDNRLTCFLSRTGNISVFACMSSLDTFPVSTKNAAARYRSTSNTNVVNDIAVVACTSSSMFPMLFKRAVAGTINAIRARNGGQGLLFPSNLISFERTDRPSRPCPLTTRHIFVWPETGPSVSLCVSV